MCACACHDEILIVLAYRSLNQKIVYMAEYIMKFWYLVDAIMDGNVESSFRMLTYFVYENERSEYLWPGVQTMLFCIIISH